MEGINSSFFMLFLMAWKYAFRLTEMCLCTWRMLGPLLKQMTLDKYWKMLASLNSRCIMCVLCLVVFLRVCFWISPLSWRSEETRANIMSIGAVFHSPAGSQTGEKLYQWSSHQHWSTPQVSPAVSHDETAKAQYVLGLKHLRMPTCGH